MRIAIVSDAWFPQTNGVVRTLDTTRKQLGRMGHDVRVIHPGMAQNFPCPTYPEIRLAWRPGRVVREQFSDFIPDCVHIATEGPLGMAARSLCLQRGWPYTTSYHTQFPEYLRARAPIPLRLSYAWLKYFHGKATRTMVATPSMQRQLESRGFNHLVRWSRGVDVELFRPRDMNFLTLPRPICVYVGRVAVEKNIEDFLKLDLPGSKLVIGDGPARAELQARYPHAVFAGYKFGEELAQHIAASDVFVFPSRTDTFGLVMLEAMACGVPVAAYPVTGPVDVVNDDVTGKLGENLHAATLAALQMNRHACREYALQFTWERASEQFFSNLAPIAHGAAQTTSKRRLGAAPSI